MTIVGDASSAQRALKSVGDSATQAEVKVEGFGKKFLALGAGFGVGAAAAGMATDALRSGTAAIFDYNKSLDTTRNQLLGMTKSQEETARILAVARAEADKGRGTYQELSAAMVGLNTVAKQANMSLSDVTQVAEILAAVNPAEGIAGATFALREAATGDMTSVIERFNLSRSTINKLRAEGVPNIEAVRRAMAELGYDTKFLDQSNQSAAKQFELLQGRLVEIGAEISKGFFSDLAKGVRNTSDELNNAESGLRKLGDAFVEVEGKINGLNTRTQEAGNQIGRNIIEGIARIPNERTADDPVEKWLQEQIARYKRSGAEIKESAKGAAQEGPKGVVAGSKPTPAQTAAIKGYGRQMLRSLVEGLTEEQLDAAEQISGVFADLFAGADGKADPDKVAAGQAAVALALRDLARDGQVSADVMRDLSAAFGMQTPEVARLIEAYGKLGRAQQGIAAANTQLAGANAALSVVNSQAAGETAHLEAALTSAQEAAQRHAEATTAALEPLQDALGDLRAAAEDAGRANAAVVAGLQGELDGLQRQAESNAAAMQAQIAAAQAAYEAAQTRRQQLQGAMNAALRGEVEEWLRINAITDEAIRKIAQKWQEEIAGQRRAKEGADDRVKSLSRQGNREELDYLNRIDAARQSGNEKEARRLERERDARRKQRGQEEERARAQAAVANDEYEQKAEQLEKEGKKVDETASKEEREAKRRVDEITAQATARKAADDAAIKAKQDQIRAVQDAGRAEQERYAAQQRGIQAEIEKVNEAAKVQAAKDKRTIEDAQTILGERQKFWQQEIGKAQEAVTQAENRATAAKNVADDSQRAFDWLERITKLQFPNLKEAAENAKTIASPQPGGGVSEGGGQTQGGVAPGRGPGGGGGGDRPQQDAGTSTGLDYSLAAPDGQWFARAGLGGGLAGLRVEPAPGAGAIRDLHIHLPNVRDLGDREQREGLYRAMRRELRDVARGGLDPGKVGV